MEQHDTAPGESGATYWTGRESGRRCDGPNEGPDCCASCVVPEAESVQIGSCVCCFSNTKLTGQQKTEKGWNYE